MAPVNYVQGEILPPSSQSLSLADEASNQHLNYIATLLDDRFSIPGTRIRFGLDALIGWIPGIGDALAAAASLVIVVAAWKRGVSRITMLRMMMNISIEASIGAIPLIGDFVHVAWKANRRNYNLLLRDQREPRAHERSDWLFVIGAVLTMIVLFVGPFVLLIYLLQTHLFNR